MRFKRQIAFILIINMLVGLGAGSELPLGVFRSEEVYGATADVVQDETEQGDAAGAADISESEEENGEISEETNPSDDVMPSDGMPSDDMPSNGIEGTEGLEIEGTEEPKEGTEGLETEVTEEPEEGTEGLETEVTEEPEEGTEGLETEGTEELEEDGIMPIDLMDPDIPANLDALEAAGRTSFNITQTQDWLNLQALSRESDLKDYTFIIGIDVSNNQADYYDLSLVDAFSGIGSEDFPFRGTLRGGYETGISLYMKQPLFSYLSSDATLSALHIRTKGCSAGLAEHFVADGEAPSLMNYENIMIEAGGIGAVTDIRSNGNAGGLFCDVVFNTDAPLLIQGKSITVNSNVNGGIAGGIIGYLGGGDVSGGREVTLVIDGGIKWAPYAAPYGNSSLKAVGGWIGKVEGVNLTVSSGDGSEIVITRTVPVDTAATKTIATGDIGGLFGLISNSTITVEDAITYTGNKQGGADYTTSDANYDLCGQNAGTFAGRIKDSSVTLNAAFTTNYVRFYKAGNTSSTTQGTGGFAGVMDNSVLAVAEDSAGISLNNTYVRSGDSASYNVGGFAGYAKDAIFAFSEDSPCTVTDFVSYNTYGNTAGVIGKYEAVQLTDQQIMQYVKVTGSNTGIVARNGNAGGLVGYLQLADAPVEISDCSVGDMKYYATYGAFGVARVQAAAGKNGRLILNNIVCNGAASASETPVPTYSTYATAFGGMIGYADADFTVKGDLTDGVFSSAVWYKAAYENISGSTKYTVAPDCFGGVAGQIVNTTADASGYREVDISDLLIGSGYEVYASRALTTYGGLIGKAGTKTSVCLDGKIYQNGGTAKGFADETFTVEPQNMYLTGTTFGSIAASIDDTLIYLQPTAEWQPSEKYRCNEIGNYGGMIRNGNWDAPTFTNPDSTTVFDPDTLVADPDKWIIRDHKITGTLGNTLSSYGDFMRFAVAMNTRGGFLPNGNTYAQIKTNTYALTGAEYNLRWLGVMSMGRNDVSGMNVSYAFQGSWNGRTGGTKIIYGLPTYRQPYIGLFPWISGKEAPVSFKNLKLEYDLSYQWPQYASSTGTLTNNTTTGYTENAGGLAVYADGAITVSNVEYMGTVSDLKNQSPYIYTNNELFGGIFGKYMVNSDQALKIDHLITGMNFTQNDHHHVFGGVIAYVDTRTNNSGKTGKIDISDVELNGKITIAVTESSNVGYQNIQDSAFITKIGNNNYESISNSTTATNFTTYTQYCTMDVKNLTVKDVVQKASSGTKQYASMGGFLGYSWIDTETTLTDVSVGKGDMPCELDGRAAFGGLIYQANGKMTIKNLDVQNWTVNAQNNTSIQSTSSYSSMTTNAAGVNCGLLIRNGQYLYLNISGYTIGDNVTVKNYSGTYFDEIVGFNKSGTSKNNGGILSVNSAAGEERHLKTGTNYVSYPNETAVTTDGTTPLKKGNPNTRYYYDLDRIDFSRDYSTWSDPQDVMIWHLLHYANQTLRPCIKDGFTSLEKNYTVASDISMEGWSIYPTPIIEQEESYTANGNKIELHAQEIINGEKSYNKPNYYAMYTDDDKSQHYQMHAGLFEKVTQNLTVSGLHLGGTYSKSVGKAGALVADEISNGVEIRNDVEVSYGKGKFEKIVLDNLKCVSSSEMTDQNYDAPMGLLIAKVVWNGIEKSGTDLEFKDIRMVNYGTDGDTTSKAASSLIGSVGDTKAKNIKILFEEMGMTDHETTARLAKSSLIYRYDYKEECTVIYTFTYQDYTGKDGKGGKDNSINSDAVYLVTIGEELTAQRVDPEDEESAALGYDLIEYFDEDYAVGKNPKDGTVLDIHYDSGKYIPYVYTGERDIIVNPKSKNIDKGCGTYEDPYVIDSVKQIQTLYRYLYEELDFKEMLEVQNWTVNATGDDSSLCNKTAGAHTPMTYYDGHTDEDFPTKAQLSQAYYQITADIDLSQFVEFFGFGTLEEPFVGVFVGAKVGGKTEFPVITLPKQPATAKLTQFGWIRNAKGAVVKDLTVQFASQINISGAYYSDTYPVTESLGDPAPGFGAGVIARVLGGENIIDNVTVSCKDGASLHPDGYYSMIGGYVGAVDFGGVILRNMSGESLKDFRTGIEAYPDSYWYTCGIVGRVRDGYVVYDGKTDGSTDSNTPLMSNYTKTQYIDYTNSLPASRSYDITNAVYLRARIGLNDVNSSKGIQWTGNGYQIANDAQLLALSMALNSGMMDYNCSVNNAGPDLVAGIGYNNKSRQRGGNYNYIGNVGNSGSDSRNAYQDVIDHDNYNNASGYTYHSYLMQFFAPSGSSIVQKGADGHESAILNPKGTILTYTLTTPYAESNAATLYNMAQYQTGFRGFGARYGRTYNNVFQSNMVGPDSGQARIELDMRVDKTQSSTRVALLNDVDSSTGQTLQFKNLVLSGTVLSEPDRPSYAVNNAAGFMSRCTASLEFDNVDLDGLEVTAPSFGGGYVADMAGTTCSFMHTDLENTTIVGGKNRYSGNYGYAGGLIGRFTQTYNSNIEVKGTESQEIRVNRVSVSSPSNSSVRVGGLIGSSLARSNSFSHIRATNINIDDSLATDSDDSINSNYAITAGGILGYAEYPVTFDHVTVGSEVPDEFVTIVAGHGSSREPNAGGGGFVGRLGSSSATLTVRDSKVLGYRRGDGTCTTQIDCYGSAGGITSNSYNANVENVTVAGAFITGGAYLGGYCGWANSGSSYQINLTNTDIAKCHFAMKCYLGNYYSGSSGRPGDIGGLIGCDEIGTTNLTDCNVSNIMIDADYTGRVGGLIGYENQKVNIRQEQNSSNGVTDSLICGVTAGGLFGQFEGSAESEINEITVSGNRIVSGADGTARGNTYRSGGLAGYLDHTGALYFNNISVTDNLIAAYSNTAYAPYMGGMIGENNRGKVYVYHTGLRDNYIGVLQDLPTVTKDRQQALREKEKPQAWKDLVYARKDVSNAANAVKYATLGAVPEEDLYQYSYCEGAVAGRVAADSLARNTFVDINIQYSDNKYRPVSDVGMSVEVKSNEAMYAAYRQNYFIVYDGMETEQSTQGGKPSWLPSELQGNGANYTFGNLEKIWNDYCSVQAGTGSGIRYAYRFSEDYLSKKNSGINIGKVYDMTYWNTEKGYLSPIEDNDSSLDGAKVPMVYYDSSEPGSLDEVIQTYINMLTNNSGALNSFDDQKIQVDTVRMSWTPEDGITKATDGKTPSVTAKVLSDKSVEFINRDSSNAQTYDTIEDEGGTFTLIKIAYLNSKNNTAEWTLLIPIFVTQRLDITTNARIVKGIEYNFQKLVEDGKWIVYNGETGPDGKPLTEGSLIDLDTGSSYSMYFEYIYGIVRNSYDKAVPKWLLKSSDQNIGFQKGMQLTLIDLDRNCTPYYYEITGDEDPDTTVKLEYFKDADGNPYEYKNITDEKGQLTVEKTPHEEIDEDTGEVYEYYYEDIGGVRYYEEVAVERYMILVDCSNVANDDQERLNYKYELRVSLESLKDSDSKFYDRIEWTEGSFAGVNETAGLIGTIDKEESKLNDKFSADKTVELSLQALLEIGAMNLQTNQDTPLYVDIGFYLTNIDGVKIPLPQGTVISFEKRVEDEDGEVTYEEVYSTPGNGAPTVYYFHNQQPSQKHNVREPGVMTNIPGSTDLSELLGLTVTFDFSAVSDAELAQLYSDAGRTIYLHADLVKFEEGKNAVDGELLDGFAWNFSLIVDTDIGFALNQDQLMVLGINTYLPEKTDEGLIPYTESIEFPDDYIKQLSDESEGQYYTIIYQMQEKSDQPVNGNLNSVYDPYTGSDIRLYLGDDPTNGGNQITDARTYQIDPKMIKQGVSFNSDKSINKEVSKSVPAGVIQIPCILRADRDELERKQKWTNYRIHAYLFITDSEPTAEEIAEFKADLTQASLDDYFVFTVARVKTDMD